MILKSKYLDVEKGEISFAKLTIENGVFKSIEPINENEVDIEGIIVPGFIDAHIHIESSLLTPAQFARGAVMSGVTSIVADPHEIANVLGMDGINFMFENAKSVPFDFYFTVPSCVPATFFETNGAVIDSKDVADLLKNDSVVGLAEVMNVPGVINDDEEVLKKIAHAKNLSKKIDGHCPLLTGEDLKKYISAGISSDHESSYFEEAIEKHESGMNIFVREGSIAKDMESLLNPVKRHNYWKSLLENGKISPDEFKDMKSNPIFKCIVSDDEHPDHIMEGYLKRDVLKAVSYGVNIIDAIRMVTINPSKHYGLSVGSITEGYKANFIVVDNLKNLNIKRTYIFGKEVFNGVSVAFNAPNVELMSSFDMSIKSPEDFDIPYNGTSVNVNVIKCDGSLITAKDIATLDVKDNVIQPDIDNDILKLAVVQRYGLNTVSNAFVNGFGFMKGAIASSIAHDSHNIIVVGTNSKDMAKAVNIIRKNKGGFSLVDGNLVESLPLPIAGLMSNEPIEVVVNQMHNIYKHLIDWSFKSFDPYMQLAFLALLVIPSIKLSDKGLFDGDSFEFIDVIRD